MTEDEWRTCSNIGEMLWKLEGKASNRKLILFCCACCRRLEHLLADGRSRRSLDAAEEGADGLVSKEEMGQLQRQAERAIQQICSVYRRTVSLELLANGNAAQAAMSAAESVARLGDTNFDLLYHVELVALKARDCLAHFAAKDVAQVIDPPEDVVHQTDIFDYRYDTDRPPIENEGHWQPADGDEYYRLPLSDRILVKGRDAKILRSAWVGELQAQCSLLRDIVGNPFRRGRVDENALTRDQSTSVNLARAIYDERAFGRMSILADALEESGCTDADVLEHCRQSAEHVRGCWVIDSLLGRK